MPNYKNRNPAMDVIRCFALFSVVSIHFFLNSGISWIEFFGMNMYLQTIVRTAFQVCVPLFIFLSGYLMNTKKPTKAYYRKIWKTLFIYTIACILCKAYCWIVLKQPISVVDLLSGILDYTAAPYAWYVEMYIGLFLLIPYLNILYHNIESKKQKEILLGILIFLSCIPNIVNIFNFSDAQWWRWPASSEVYCYLIPDWWVDLYPITYYFVGCFLKEYPPKWSSRKCMVCYVLVTLAAGTFNYYRSRGSMFVWGEWQKWGSPLILAQTVFLFVFFLNADYRYLKEKTGNLLAKVSDWSFGAYLVSWIFDDYFYKLVAIAEPAITRRILYFPLVVPAVYVCSLCLSAAMNAVYAFLHKTVESMGKEVCGN